MKYFVIDVGGSSIKYAVIDESLNIIKKGKSESRHLRDPEEFVSCLKNLYLENGSCPGGIAISYCGELNEKTGYLHSGGSYKYMAGRNLKELMQNACGTTVSVENDGNCAGLAESRYGILKGFNNAAVIVIGTGLGGALILDGKLYHGTHGYAGATSLLTRNIEVKYTKQSWAFRVAGAAAPGRRYDEEKGLPAQTTDGIAFFKAVEENDETAINILKEYSSILANVLFNIHLILDLEAIAIGGGISQQPLLLQYLQQAFDDIYTTQGMPALNIPRPDLRVCKYHNDANLIGALCHHMNQMNTES
jgi:predicted NBD/HSP70 family sugar kinase